ncbi:MULTISPECIES: 2-hydroxychromene-2-carboxylate isomerase [unclassified Rhizobium]|uniref:2-hydroxychromene-2-carboxylate isomerase n=1 Tax=unclassified Rhizobium TaxID=2613769 RepID=UPI001C82C2C1|nr:MULTISPECIES: DsbA family protein [unclassified Rhizobium]MBX5227380.1 2-hydroxychromene-2-carboxylate isomerase [Rhizobium sp. NLR9b]MBX5238996.1 2-hydroxychromene-2-carboxylate isomerase [Rhizobium sp. NLR22b]MBX5288424.1 2-hydroxychromene-2-carboxylate isomerase [Rhizobium sp. NLR10b]
MTKAIDYFFGIGSPWSFIGLDAFTELAGRHGASIRPHVISIIEDNGGIYSRNRPEARRAYWTKDLKRWAALRGKTLSLENRSALSDPTPAGFMVIAAIEDGLDWLKLTRALQAAFWTNGDDIGRSEIRQAIAQTAGFDGTKLEDRARSEAIQSVWRSNIEGAKNAGIFGLPTFRYEDELYWGQDSLPFLERHLKGEKIAV